jgi:hypothetical protein
MANKTYSKKNQEKLRVFLEKQKQGNDTKSSDKKNRGYRECSQSNQVSILRKCL